MGDQSDDLNFVERRARLRRTLAENAETVWQNLRSHIQGCCESYVSLYGTRVRCVLENGHRIKIEKTFPADGRRLMYDATSSLLISYDRTEYTIRAVNQTTTVAEFRITSDSSRALLVDAKGVEKDMDQAAEACIGKFIFAEEPDSRPSV